MKPHFINQIGLTMRRKLTGNFCLLVLSLIVHHFCGCCHERMVVAVTVNGDRENIRTRFRYRLFESHSEYERWIKGISDLTDGCLTDKMAQYYPNVFSKDGIPILCEVVGGETRKGHRKWPANEGEELLCLLYELPTGFALPCNYAGYTSSCSMQVKVLVNNREKSESFRVFRQVDAIVSPLSPLSWLFFNGNPVPEDFEKAYVFEDHRWNCFSKGMDADIRAMAYAVAVKVMELERLAVITDKTLADATFDRMEADRARLVKAEEESKAVLDHYRERRGAMKVAGNRNESQSKEVTYRIVRLERNSNKDLHYSFAVELIGEDGKDPLQGFRKVQQDFRVAILNDYVATYSKGKQGSARVDFYGLKQNAQKVEGTAVVISVHPLSLIYDQQTHKGTITVRFGVNQYEEARDWARRNIETLARDKNIALVTGQLPPEARYYSLGEKLKDGNVLEIEFKTE